MTKPRRKPNTRFHAFIVEPSPDFQPSNWQQTPRHYRIVSYAGPKDFRGPADAWKFLYNHDALQRGDQSRWAICLDFEMPIRNQIRPDDPAEKSVSDRSFSSDPSRPELGELLPVG